MCLLSYPSQRDTHIHGCYGLHSFRGRPEQHWGQQTLWAPVTPIQAQSSPVHKELLLVYTTNLLLVPKERASSSLSCFNN